MKPLVTVFVCAFLAACDSKEPVGRYQVFVDANNSWIIRTDTATGRVWSWHGGEPGHWDQLGSVAP